MAPRTICLSEAEADSRYFYIPKDALQRHCPLNPGPPTFDGAPTIGAFARLPAELQLDVIEMLDFKSLLAFRRVNKEAANLVEGMSAWKLVLACAPNALRMSIGLRTHHTFTLSHLLSAISVRHCAVCGKETTSLDMLDLRRVCVRTNGYDFPECKSKIAGFNELLVFGLLY